MSEEGMSWPNTPAATLHQAPKKNGRLGSRKTRTGCIICKSRRVKCDETRPECNRCSTAGRRCEYATTTKAISNSPFNVGMQLAQTLGLRDSDRRTFDFFLSATAPKIAGPLDKEFWSGYVLQLAQGESFVLDSLLAISILYEHPQYLVSFRGDPFTRPASGDMNHSALQSREAEQKSAFDNHHARAVHHYNKAIAAFKQKMESGQASLLLALLSCSLFICIETIRDNVFAALDLFTRGTELIKKFSDAKLNSEEQRLVNVIRLMFSRLGILAAAFRHPYPLELPAECKTVTTQTTFATMTDARTALFSLMGESHLFIRDAEAYTASIMGEPVQPDVVGDSMFGEKFGSLRPDLPTLDDDAMSETGSPMFETSVSAHSGENVNLVSRRFVIPDDPSTHTPGLGESHPHKPELQDLITRQNHLEQRLKQWYNAFQLPRVAYALTEPEVISNLLMFYHVSYIWLASRLSPSQTAFDQYNAHFNEIISQAESFIRAKASTNPHFTFEVGAVPPLYFVATKCRVPSLRRKALQALSRAPRKECIWGATSTGQLASRLIEIEEDGLGLAPPTWDGYSADEAYIDDSKMPAESSRVHNLEIMRNSTTGAFEIRITRYQDADDGVMKKVVEDFAI